MIIWAYIISDILLCYIYLSSGQQQLSTNRKKRGIVSGDFIEYLTVIPNRFYMTNYTKKTVKKELSEY